MKSIFIAEPYYSVCRYIEETLVKHGYEAWLVGGSVRDLLIAGRLSDLDYTTNARPEAVQKIFPRTVPVGIKFGTLLVLYRGQKVEVTTYRADADYEDGRRPSTVEYAQELAVDIRRRDFTINGLAYSVLKKQLADYCGGVDDLERKLLRTIGDPMQRFSEDGLRPIRGCRIAAKLGFEIEPNTLTAMRHCVPITSKVAPERFFDEWRKTLRMKNRRSYWHHLLEAHILPAFLPHIAEAFVGEARDQFLREIDHLQMRSMAEYAAALFFLLQITDRGKIEQTLRGTKFPTADMKLCLNLLDSPLLRIADAHGRLDLKRALAQTGRRDRIAHMRFATQMRAALQTSSGLQPGPVRKGRELAVSLYKSIRRSGEPLDISDLAVTGTDLQAKGLQGRAVGEALEKLKLIVLEQPQLNTRERLLQLVGKST
ncbi:CCA tRNA nucleotidyltransferase [Turneriella parva]|uniref:Polynucleotide adenylyltransferase region n=1 Tax=Turneriella parva (strain ATCC BAA-1111 / DSM 21527 / NCTC 11395 / H) TaxID=869212 RepID=I4B447_TURPD|nr:[cytidine(C)-cytidine(C)-adenosine (A)]-adding enzyme [Turneriella parva]AFM12054.1 Polynucleotide adenylyltransferase region [Turneriella parva DSM 21527]